MKRTTLLIALVLAGPLAAGAAEWRQFRGNDNHSVTDRVPPTDWNTEKNVRWKSAVPGPSASGPIVVGDRVAITAVTGFKQDRLHVAGYDATDGKRLWHRQFWATGRTQCHPFSSVAAPTPASDGKRIFAFYSCNDLVCLDLDGNVEWIRGLTHDYPTAANDVGMASSPLVVGDTVVVQIENEGDSFAAGIDTKTGKERWRVKRTQRMNWTSPAVLRNRQGGDLVLLQSPDRLTAHDPRSGELRWSHEAECENIASPVALGDTVLLPSGGLTALKPQASSASVEILWKQNKLSPGAASPLVHRDRIYTLKRDGVLTCGQLKDGEILWQLRLKGPFWATPIAAGDYLFCVNHDGLGQVVGLSGKKGEIVARNELGDKVLGTPAAADGALFIRGEKHLWKIAAQ